MSTERIWRGLADYFHDGGMEFRPRDLSPDQALKQCLVACA